MTNKYIANGNEIPSDFNLAKATSERLLKDIQETREAEERAAIVEQDPSMGDELDYEEDFKKARRNISAMLETSNRAIEEYFSMAVETDSPRAFEVLGNMIKQTVEMNKDYLDIYQQKENRKKAQRTASDDLPPGVTNNTQNNIMLSPTDLVEMIKSGGILSPPDAPD